VQVVTSPQHQAMGEIFAEMNRMQEDLAAFRQRVDTLSASATSAKRMLTVTVNNKGELTKVKFNNDLYRDMAPVELSKAVQETINRARGLVATKVQDAMGSLTGPGGITFEEVRSGTADLAKMLPASLPTSPADVLKFLRGEQPAAAPSDGKE
jgi:DNA-binding protein YbaB